MRDLDRHPLDLLDRFGAGDLEPARAVRVQAHLAGCASCAGELARWQVLYGGLARLPRPAVPPGLRFRILEAVARENARARVLAQARRRRLVAALTWSYAAGIAVVAGVALGLAFVPAFREAAGSALAVALSGAARAGLAAVDGVSLFVAGAGTATRFLSNQLSWVGTLGRAAETVGGVAGAGWLFVLLAVSLFTAVFMRFLHQRESEQEVPHVGPMLA